MVVITLQYINIALIHIALNQCIIYLRLAQCYTSIVSTKKESDF